jgi:hypothetical protein
MNDKPLTQENAKEETIIQDGVSCPQKPPWAPWVGKVSGLPFILILGLAIFILVQTDIIKLLIWLAVLVIFVYPLRFLVCARCPYYGEQCCSGMGKLIPHLFRKQEGKSMKPGLWLDVFFYLLLFLLPLPEVWQYGGLLMTILWIAAFLLSFVVMSRLNCYACPFSFCPMNKAGKAFWGLFG